MFTCLQAAQLRLKEIVLKSNVLSQPTVTVSILHERVGGLEVSICQRAKSSTHSIKLGSFKISVDADSSLELQMCNAQGATKRKLSTQHLIL